MKILLLTYIHLYRLINNAYNKNVETIY